MVAELANFARAEGGYRSLYLHTYAASPGAEALWRSVGKLVLDERTETGGDKETLHFEVPMV
ncbi:hypothetical protein ACQI4E_26080 [Streptomyces sp. CA-252508]|uniref:hypothetical protein n=1 Tax=Streptomyces sp. CA-252508 TaxID=3418946 RepID=UPI003D919C98